jgi:hypothetical protein
MEKPLRFGRARGAWWCSGDNKGESIVRLDAKRLGVRVRIPSGERVTMPLGQTTVVIGFPPTA